MQEMYLQKETTSYIDKAAFGMELVLEEEIRREQLNTLNKFLCDTF